MRYALDILAILMVVPKVQLVLADTVDVLDETRSSVSTVGQYSCFYFHLCPVLQIFCPGRVLSVCLLSAAGMSIILGVAEGEVFANDAEIQKSALQVSRWL